VRKAPEQSHVSVEDSHKGEHSYRGTFILALQGQKFITIAVLYTKSGNPVLSHSICLSLHAKVYFTWCRRAAAAGEFIPWQPNASRFHSYLSCENVAVRVKGKGKQITDFGFQSRIR
jgi:hypothetical protein